MAHIIIVHLLRTVAAAAQLSAGLDRKRRVVQDQLLHPLLHGVRQLIALGVEHLDAVILIGIMAGGDDHTGVRLFLHRQERHGRRGDHAQHQHVATHRADTGGQRRLQHIGGNAGVLTNGDEGSAAQLLLQNDRHRLPHVEGKLRRQCFSHYAADTVRTK